MNTTTTQLPVKEFQIDAVFAEELAVQVEDGDLVAEPVEPVLVVGQRDVHRLQANIGKSASAQLIYRSREQKIEEKTSCRVPYVISIQCQAYTVFVGFD